MDIFTVIVGGILALFMLYVLLRMSYVIMRNVIVGMEFRKNLARQVHALRLNKMLTALGVKGLPTTVLINAGGDEVGRVVGVAEWDSDEAVAFLRRCLGTAPQ